VAEERAAASRAEQDVRHAQLNELGAALQQRERATQQGEAELKMRQR
jgi:hypothetical protein